MIALLVMTDGREEIYRTIPYAEAMLSGPISEKWIHDDSGDPANTARLRRLFPDWNVISTVHRAGFGGAIRSAWQTLRLLSDTDYIFHLEDDFEISRLIPLNSMARILTLEPHLVQLALRRQPWNQEELAAGGIVEQHPEDWTDHELDGLEWLSSRRNFTTNPCLYRRSLIAETEWPEGPYSEGRYSIGLLAADELLRFGYYGSRSSGEMCRHVGTHRNGIGY